MSTDNLLITLISYQIALMTIGAIYYFYKNRTKKESHEPVVIEIEGLGKDHKGFGYIRGKSLVLNEKGHPYLYKTYSEAKRRMKRVRDVDRIVFQQWDMETQQVLVAEVKSGSN